MTGAELEPSTVGRALHRQGVLRWRPGCGGGPRNGHFSFPAQSGFSVRRSPYGPVWVEWEGEDPHGHRLDQCRSLLEAEGYQVAIVYNGRPRLAVSFGKQI